MTTVMEIGCYNQDKNSNCDIGMMVIMSAQDTNDPTRDVGASLVPARTRTLPLARLPLPQRRRLFHPHKPSRKPVLRPRTRALYTPSKLSIERRTVYSQSAAAVRRNSALVYERAVKPTTKSAERSIQSGRRRV